jgi:hypothetical protein
VNGPQILAKRKATDRPADSPLPASADQTLPSVETVLVPVAEEALVADTRAGLSPAQLVERKLISLLKNHPLPMSHVQMMAAGMKRSR